MEKVIISGADGFVGSYTVEKFLAEGCEVLALGLRPTPRRLKIPAAGIKYLQCDVSSKEQLLGKIPHNYYDTFIHFAWAGVSGLARADYNLQMQNALNTVECMKAAKELGCSRFICAGSLMEYEIETTVHEQESCPEMGYIYGMGKYIAHCLCKSVAANIGIELIWPIITNAYGVGDESPRLVNTTLRKAISGEPMQFVPATQNYDFVYITDVANAFYLVAKKGRPFCEYMIGSGHARPLKEFILEMLRKYAPDVEPVFGMMPFTGAELPLSTFDISAIVQDCGFKPKISFAEGIDMTMEWLRSK